MIGLNIAWHSAHGQQDIILISQREYVRLSLHCRRPPEATGQNVICEGRADLADTICPLKTGTGIMRQYKMQYLRKAIVTLLLLISQLHTHTKE